MFFVFFPKIFYLFRKSQQKLLFIFKNFNSTQTEFMHQSCPKFYVILLKGGKKKKKKKPENRRGNESTKLPLNNAQQFQLPSKKFSYTSLKFNFPIKIIFKNLSLSLSLSLYTSWPPNYNSLSLSLLLGAVSLLCK